MDDDSEEVQALQVEIEQLEAELARTGRKEELTAPQNELLTAHLLCENTQALVTAFKTDDLELAAEFGDHESCAQQIEALIALSGISFSNVRSGPVQLRGGVSRGMVLEASTCSGLAFELELVVQESHAAGGGQQAKVEGKICSAQLIVPLQFRAELADLIRSAKDNCAVTTILRGLARYSQAAAERQRLFQCLKQQYPAWVDLPHGTDGTALLSVRPPARSVAPFVFDFRWQLRVTVTGQLIHETTLLPNASRQFLECEEGHEVLQQLPAQFEHLARAKGLEGALQIMLAVVSNADNVT